jgi:hypothetical protein
MAHFDDKHAFEDEGRKIDEINALIYHRIEISSTSLPSFYISLVSLHPCHRIIKSFQPKRSLENTLQRDFSNSHKWWIKKVREKKTL